MFIAIQTAFSFSLPECSKKISVLQRRKWVISFQMISDLLQKTIKYLFKIADHYTKVNRHSSFISAGTVKYLLLLRICILLYSLRSMLCPGHFSSKECTFFYNLFLQKAFKTPIFSVLLKTVTLRMAALWKKAHQGSLGLFTMNSGLPCCCLPGHAHCYCPIVSLFSHSHCCYPYGMVSISEYYS